jgi:hypothetical protein
MGPSGKGKGKGVNRGHDDMRRDNDQWRDDSRKIAKALAQDQKKKQIKKVAHRDDIDDDEVVDNTEGGDGVETEREFRSRGKCLL